MSFLPSRLLIPVVLMLAPGGAHAAVDLRQPPPAVSPEWPRPGRDPLLSVERANGFVAGGTGLVSSRSLANAWLLRSWNATAGVELPIGRRWTLVPRLHFSGATGTNSGAIRWARLALDGRVTRRAGALRSYQEAGLGMGVLDSPVTTVDASFQAHHEQRTTGSPFAQLVVGLGGRPDRAVAWQFEAIVVVGGGAETPVALEGLAGITF